VIAGDYKKYTEAIKTTPPGKVLDDMGYKRYCCRRMMLSQ
jgi:DNA-directed RNA polymerase subunit N